MLKTTVFIILSEVKVSASTRLSKGFLVHYFLVGPSGGFKILPAYSTVPVILGSTVCNMSAAVVCVLKNDESSSLPIWAGI